MNINGFKTGVAIDVNGNSYYFDVFEGANYRISRIEKYESSIMEVTNERYFKKNS